MSKIGVHVVIGPRNGFGPFLHQCSDAGQPVAVVKCVDDFGAALEAKQVNRQTLTIGRLNTVNNIDMQGRNPEDWPSARDAAIAYYRLVQPLWRAQPHIDVWETFNEMSAHWGWQGEFFVAMMDLAEADGFKLAHYACSSGNPPNENAADEMIACLQETKRRGHYLSLHEYGGIGPLPDSSMRGGAPYHTLRYRWLYGILRQRDADAPLLITECGPNAGFEFPGVGSLLADVEWYDGELIQDGFVHSAALWTLGNWRDANFQDALPALADYIVAHPTPPPPKPRGAPRGQYKRRYVVIHPGQAQREEYYTVAGRHQVTVGPSADDAGIGDLDVRDVILVNPDLWGGDAVMREWYNTNYPGVLYHGVVAPAPADLEVWLGANLIG